MKNIITRATVIIASLFIGSSLLAQTDTYTFLYHNGFPTFAARRTNNHGVTVGAFAFGGILFKDGNVTLFPLPGSNTQTPQVVDINDRGDIVGEYFTPASVGFLLKNGALTTIEVPGGVRTSPNGLNNHGVIVGTFRVSNQSQSSQGFIFKDGVYTPVAVPGATFVVISDINDNGDAVGFATTVNGLTSTTTSFTYRDGIVTPLPNFPGADRTLALSINKSGEIVGQILNLQPAELQRGFILRNGAFETFRIPGALSFVANGITDKGDVTGTYFTPDVEGTSFIRRAE
jgi:hypothetical protein